MNNPQIFMIVTPSGEVGTYYTYREAKEDLNTFELADQMAGVFERNYYKIISVNKVD